jgi:twitching motility protein PilT
MDNTQTSAYPMGASASGTQTRATHGRPSDVFGAPETRPDAHADAYADGHGAEDDTFLHALLTAAVAAKASDLHISAGRPPMIRRNGELQALEMTGRWADACHTFTPPETSELIEGLFGEDEWVDFLVGHESDRSYEVPGVSRFRVNVYLDRGTVAAAFRPIPHSIPPLDSLGVPEAVTRLARLPRGLVLVTGPTGSGKSTTLAAVLDQANESLRAHIITIEDPIEFMHTHKLSVVNQREIGADTDTFAGALRAALRQDPDIILVGELRDLETTRTAITAAETGHLVLATLHTRGATDSVNRIIDIFPPEQQAQIRTQLAGVLQAVVSQALLPRKRGDGRQLVAEVLLTSPAVRNLIREGKTHQLLNSMQSSLGDGMTTFDRELARLVREDTVAYSDAVTLSYDAVEFARLSGRSAA